MAETFAVFKVETSEFDTLNVHAVNFLSGLIFYQDLELKSKRFKWTENGETKTSDVKIWCINSK